MIIQVKCFSPGKRWDEEVELTDLESSKYNELSSLGCRLTAETLRTGHISQCIEHNDGDYDMTLTSGI